MLNGELKVRVLLEGNCFRCKLMVFVGGVVVDGFFFLLFVCFVEVCIVKLEVWKKLREVIEELKEKIEKVMKVVKKNV